MPEKKVKKCHKCGNTKPLTEFSMRKASPDGYNYICKDCDRAQVKANYEKRKAAKKSKEYYQETREERLAHNREYYRKHKAERLAKHHAYQKKNKHVMQKANAKRRQAMRDRGREPYTREEIIKRDTVDGVLICGICGLSIDDLKDMQIDHIIPISQGGRDIKSNVRCTHRKCNLERPKDARDLAKEEVAALPTDVSVANINTVPKPKKVRIKRK